MILGCSSILLISLIVGLFILRKIWTRHKDLANDQLGLQLEPVEPISGTFVTRLVGPAGGIISIYGVSLEIPPEALLDEKEIRLGISWEPNHQPALDRKTALVSPVVSCEPHGLHFHKPVKLILPHCAHAEGTASLEHVWKFNIMQSETPLEAGTNWLETSSQDVSLGEIIPSKISFHVRHFTLYAIVGQILQLGHRKWLLKGCD